MLRKQAAKFGVQWNQYLSGVLWAYHNTPTHSSTGEKPSFLLFSFDCRSPMEAALIPTKPLKPTNITDYREQMMLSLSSARKLAEQTNKEAQKCYKQQYDKTARESKIKVGDWVLIYFAQEETGKNRKLSQPWYGPYRVISQILLYRKSIFQMIQTYRSISQESNIVQSCFLLDSIGTETRGQNQVDLQNIFSNN